MTAALSQRLTAEALGALLLTGAVIGSGISAARLAGGNGALALLANTGATAAILFVLITALAPISGAHFNPAVTLAAALRRELSTGEAALYVIAQCAGCIAGAILAHAMFALPLVQIGTQVRAGWAQALSESVATFALVLTILLVSRTRPHALAAAVSLTIGAGYWWTASTSFANPAITLARALTYTFAGIRPQDVPVFILVQTLGALAALSAASVLRAPHPKPANR